MKVLLRLGLAAALTVGGFAATTLPAQAALPLHCVTKSKTAKSGTVYCYASASKSQFRAKAACRHITPTGSEDNYTAYGKWQKQGDEAASTATCDGSDSLQTLDAQLK